jgi:quercetin dioxygenase-like cupin family protein
MSTQSVFLLIKHLSFFGFAAIDGYAMKPKSSEQKHFHDGWEIVYVQKGNCKTHKQRKLYIYPPKKVHEVINDSNDEIIFICLTIPPESEKNTHYV